MNNEVRIFQDDFESIDLNLKQVKFKLRSFPLPSCKRKLANKYCKDSKIELQSCELHSLWAYTIRLLEQIFAGHKKPATGIEPAPLTSQLSTPRILHATEVFKYSIFFLS